MSFSRPGHSPRPVPQRQRGAGNLPIPHNGAVRPAGPAPDDGVGRYPFIVVQLMSTVYQAEKVEVSHGEASAGVGFKTSFVRHPSPFKSDGQISDEARDLLLAEVLAAVRKTGFRMCVVWGPAWCSFVEADGSIKGSFAPPSGGFLLPSPIEFEGPATLAARQLDSVNKLPKSGL